MIRLLSGLAAMSLLATGALAADFTVADPKIRAMLPNQPTAAAYMELRNEGTEADALLSASSPEAGSIELHSMSMEGDVMKMRPLEGSVEVPAGGTAVLAPGGLHMMLVDPSRTFAEGETVPVTLRFERAGEIEVAFPVVSDVSAAADHDATAHGMAVHAAHGGHEAHGAAAASQGH